jgi:hypothetical protein
MVSPAHDFMGGIIKKVIHIKFQYFRGRKVIVKESFSHIDGSTEINIVIPEIDEGNPFLKGQGRSSGIIMNGQGSIRKQAFSLLIGGSCLLTGRKAAKTDMFSPAGQGRAEIGASVFSGCRENPRLFC